VLCLIFGIFTRVESGEGACPTPQIVEIKLLLMKCIFVMSVICRTQSTTSFVTSLNCSVSYLSFSLCPTFVLLLQLAVSAIHVEELLGLTNNNDILFDFCGKITCCLI